MRQEQNDGNEPDKPPGPTLAGDHQPDQGEAEDQNDSDQRPLESAGEEDEFDAMRVLGPEWVDAIGDEGGGYGGEDEKEKREEHSFTIASLHGNQKSESKRGSA